MAQHPPATIAPGLIRLQTDALTARQAEIFSAPSPGAYLFNPYGKTKAARSRIALTATARRVLARQIVDCGPYLFSCGTDPKRPVPNVNNAYDRAVKASGVAPFGCVTFAILGPLVLRNLALTL